MREIALRELALFAGAGGGILGGILLGWQTVCAVELDAFCARRLLQRQNEGHLPPFPIWDDVCSFDGHPWRGAVDVVSGGFPCQDISIAGKKRGIDGERSGLWHEMARIVDEVRPAHVFVENSPNLVRRGLARVLGDLATLGYDARWTVLGADDVGAPHRRKRIWILASDPKCHALRLVEQRMSGRQESSICDEGETLVVDNGKKELLADSEQSRPQRGTWEDLPGSRRAQIEPARRGWWEIEPDVGRVAHGVAAWIDRLRATGNGQVPGVVKLAWNTLHENH